MTIQKNISLKRLTTFGVGGQAAYYLRVKTPEELVAAVLGAKQNLIPYWLIAGGSNVVFGDEKFQGLVIHYHQPRGSTSWKNGVGICGAGLPLADLISSSIKSGFVGLEALSGIPGTVGGAVVGNAGAYGQCISDHLVGVQVYTTPLTPSLIKEGVARVVAGGGLRWLTKKQCQFVYRDSIFKKPAGKNYLVLRVKFKLQKGDKKLLAKKSREIIKIRAAKYKPGLKCPGSFFKNVLVKDVAKKSLAKIDPAKIRDGKINTGWLLEQVGAKGFKRGGVAIANFHGNLLINTGRATYRDVRTLANLLKKRVYRKFGIKLEEEVRYMI